MRKTIVQTVLSFLITFCVINAKAQTNRFIVTNTDNAGVGSLRQAISDANAKPGPDIITFNNGISGTISLTSTLNITDTISVFGPGSSNIAINGNNAVQILTITKGIVHIQGLSFKNGLSQGGNGQSAGPSGGGGGAGLGGAIAIETASVYIFDVIFDNNKAKGGNGGSCTGSTSAGQIDLTPGGVGGNGPFGAGGYGGTSQHLGSGGTGGNGTTLGAGGGGGGGASGNPIVVSGPGGNGNFGGGGGGVGGIGSAGTVSTVVGLGGTFAGNGGIGNPATTGMVATLQPGGAGGGGAGLGGAIFINAGILTLQNCTFINNSATGGAKGTSLGETQAAGNGQGKGGAIFANTATLAVQNVTFTNNTASNQGGTANDGNNVYGTTKNFIFQISKAVNELLYDNYRVTLIGKFLRNATALSLYGKTLSNFQAFAVSDTTKDSVSAILPVGLIEGPITVSAQGVTNQTPFFIKKISVPNKITDLAAVSSGVEQIKLTWSDINNSEQGYRIYKSTNNGSTYVAYDSVGINANSYTDNKAANNQTSYYKIVPIYYSYVIPFSNVVNAKTPLGKKLTVNLSVDEQNERCANVPFVYTVTPYLDNVEDTRNVYTFEWFINGVSKGNNNKVFNALLNSSKDSDSVYVKISSTDSLTLNNNKLWKSWTHVSNVIPISNPVVSITPANLTYCRGNKVELVANVDRYDYNGNFTINWFVNGKPKYFNRNIYSDWQPSLDSLNEGDQITFTTVNQSSCVNGLVLSSTSAPYTIQFTDGPKVISVPKDTLVTAGTTLNLKVVASDTVPITYNWQYFNYYSNQSKISVAWDYDTDEAYSATKQYAIGVKTNTITLNNVNAKPDVFGTVINKYRLKMTGLCTSYTDTIIVKPQTLINVTNANTSGAGSLVDGLATLKSGGTNYNSPYIKVVFANGLSGNFKMSNITLPSSTKEFKMINPSNFSIVLEPLDNSGFMFSLSNVADSVVFQKISFSGLNTATYALYTGSAHTLLNTCNFVGFDGGNDFGVIYGKDLTISNNIIYSNKARAVYSNGQLNMFKTIIRNNSFGGVYLNNNNNASLVSQIRESAIIRNGSSTNYNNSAAIDIDGKEAKLNLINSTVALNFSNNNSIIGINNGKLTAINSTIANNITNWSAVYPKDGTFSLSNTILVGTQYTDKVTKGYDLRKEDAAKFVSEFGHNLIGRVLNTNEFGLPILPKVDISNTQQTAGYSDAITGTVFNVNGKSVVEDSLNYNGSTYTLPLISCSPAINSASLFSAPFNDQRGNLRFDGKPDIGAFESSGLTTNEISTPKITISPVRQDLCSFKDTVTFTAKVQNGGTAPLVIWYNNGTMVDTGLVANFETTIESQVVANVISNASCIAKNGAVSPFVVFNNSGTYYTLDKDTTVCNSFIYKGINLESSGIYPFSIKKKNSSCDSVVVKLNVTFNNPNSYGRFTGTVFKNNIKYGTYVHLYKLSDSPNTLPTLRSQNYFIGDFDYEYLEWGRYVILAMPEPNKVTEIPTYYSGDYKFTSAQVFEVGCKTFEYKNLNFNVEQLKTLPTGAGSIAGSVKSGIPVAKTAALSDIRVYLIHLPEGDVVGQTLTNANAEFSFGNLPDGDYKTIADIPGYKSDTSTIITLSSGNTSKISSLCIDETNFKIGTCNKVTTVTEVGHDVLTVYPNPSKGIFHLNFEEASYKVYNSYGQLILSGSNQQIDLTTFPSNIYLMQVIVGDSVKEYKLIKH